MCRRGVRHARRLLGRARGSGRELPGRPGALQGASPGPSGSGGQGGSREVRRSSEGAAGVRSADAAAGPGGVAARQGRRGRRPPDGAGARLAGRRGAAQRRGAGAWSPPEPHGGAGLPHGGCPRGARDGRAGGGGSAPPLEVWGEPRPRRAAQADVATVLSAAAQLPDPAGGASAAHQDAVSCIPWGRWDADELDRLMQLLEGGRTLQEPSLRMAAMLPAVGMFDGAAFGTSSAEAVLMDPQQRVLLQVAWEALQGASGAAGLTEAALEGAGAYVGVQQMEYNHLMVRHKAAQSPWMATGVALSVVAGRLSYTYGLRGEAVSVDTACSASLVGLRLAGGVNLTPLGESTRVAQLAGMLSGDARCKTLDAAADGYVRGEACECLVLS